MVIGSDIMTDNFINTSPELRFICKILDQIDVPDSVIYTYDFQGKPYNITIKRIGLNPAMALQVYRRFGVKGIQHSAPTIFFWNAVDAPKAVCDDFKAKIGDKIFDAIQESMIDA